MGFISVFNSVFNSCVNVDFGYVFNGPALAVA
jgi:hypothetical protein